MSADAPSPAPVAADPFAGGRSLGIGSLPHRDERAAAAFALSEFDVATVPSLPMRSSAEGMVAQAIAGLPGVSFGQYGSLAIDPAHLLDDQPITTDLRGESFAGLRAFLELAATVHHDGEPVKWQFVGPVTLGAALQRAGLRSAHAFSLAAEAVRRHVVAIAGEITAALPSSPQLMLLDEPWLSRLMEPDFPIPPDVAVDLISTGMAAVDAHVVVGIHCCGPCDVATMLESGPQVVSLPVSDDLAAYAGYLGRFIAGGGTIAWGAVPTTGPVTMRPDRYWRALSHVWDLLVERGVDPRALRRRSLVTPVCGFDQHQVSTARRVARMCGEIGQRVGVQASSAHLGLGA